MTRALGRLLSPMFLAPIVVVGVLSFLAGGAWLAASRVAAVDFAAYAFVVLAVPPPAKLNPLPAPSSGLSWLAWGASTDHLATGLRCGRRRPRVGSPYAINVGDRRPGFGASVISR
jgi:hypothetical protein